MIFWILVTAALWCVVCALVKRFHVGEQAGKLDRNVSVEQANGMIASLGIGMQIAHLYASLAVVFALLATAFK